MPGPVFLEGDRITIRVAQPEDNEFLLRLWNDKSVRYQTGLRGPYSAEAFEDMVAGEHDCRLLPCRDGTPVGDVVLQQVDMDARNAELGYAIHPDEEGQGYATEAAELALQHAFDGIGLHRVWAKVNEGNEASMRVLEKLGFEHEGVMRDELYSKHGEYWDFHYFGILESEWEPDDLRSD